MDVRLGGIYGLERLMRDAPYDQPTVVTLLTAYVREHSRAGDGSADARPATDVQVAMTVLANRDAARDGGGDFDLRNVRLRNLAYMGIWDRARQRVIGINFPEADFSDADLSSADLGHADLTGAVLVGTSLREATLDGTELADAALTDADLSRSRLLRADLRRIQATGAHFDDTYLTRAVLKVPVCSEPVSSVPARPAPFRAART
ncbi:pentapeptide repeat-containing protein [Streptomyces sp. NPDC094149]|uniref:pentapeptide repeat-containing protein n=1 Tax=Streptomyces sp. NPDC094149 TaxID=3155079 RepID=UPI0033321D0C